MVQVAAGGKRHLYHKALHEKYGRYVRIGPNALSIVDANAIFPVLGAKGWPRGETYAGHNPKGSGRNLIQAADAAIHAERRRAWNPGFTHEAIKDYDEIVINRTRQLIDILRQFTGVVDIGKWINFYNFDFMCDLVFGGGFEMMKEGKDTDGIWKIIIDGTRITGITMYIPWIGRFLAWFPVGKEITKLRAFASRQGDMRRTRGSMVKDLFYHFSREDHGTHLPTQEDLIEDNLLAIVAGSDTTSTTMTNLIYLLLTHPHVYKVLQKELDNTEDVAGHDQVANLPYLDACIKETLRLFPAVSSVLNRTSPKGGVVLSGHFIPGGTYVYLPQYTYHHDPFYFTSPDTFRPERWLTSKLTESGNQPVGIIHNEEAYFPFSFGPANCIGKQLAYREMRMVLTSLLKEYDLRLADGYNAEKYLSVLRDDTVLAKGELPVVLVQKTEQKL